MRVLVAAVAVLAFLVRHWAALVVCAIVALVAFVFVPRGMFEAIILAGCVAAGVAVGSWWT
jgi:hypothetical protein